MGAVLYEDSLQKDGEHEVKHGWLAAHGVEVVRTRFDGRHGVPVSFGDYYAEGSNVVVDTKRDVHELMGNLGSDYRRLDHECARAAEAGYRIVFVVECGGAYADPERLSKVVSKYCTTKCDKLKLRECDPSDEDGDCPKRGRRRKPFQGYMMMGKMAVLHRKHGAEFEFVEPQDSARRICELLGVKYEQEGAQASLDGG